ncbi:hypothetical protein F2Q68_00027062 [Brassica cretica]|uniref:DC1 domain-containing protein n=1 Tax=Brassica cretica TaxID=69181 RepID=A0A8S9IHN4_BRACR|nr:hypothetical protein F2Q68_00027062 [Brassica cretica]
MAVKPTALGRPTVAPLATTIFTSSVPYVPLHSSALSSTPRAQVSTPGETCMRHLQRINQRAVYQCKTCGFDVHPLCTQLPKEVIHNHEYTKQVQVRESHTGSTSKTVRVMVLGAGVAWLCMTGDVSGVVSAFL